MKTLQLEYGFDNGNCFFKITNMNTVPRVIHRCLAPNTKQGRDNIKKSAGTILGMYARKGYKVIKIIGW